MKFTIDTQSFSEALSTASHAMSARSTMPVLEGILIETDGGFLNITCSDGGMTISARVMAHIQEDGRVIVPGRLFQDVIRRLPQEQMNVTVSPSMVATVRCAGSRMTIAGKSADLFPNLPSFDEKRRVSISQRLFRDMIQKTSFAVGVEEAHKILTGCLLDISAGEARMVALDGFRFAIRSASVPNAPDMNAVIPGRFRQERAKILSDEDDRLCTLIFGENQIRVEMDDVKIFSTLLEGEFINYRRIIPESSKTVVKVLNRDQLSQCVERAALMARENKSNIVRLDIGGDKMVMTSTSEMGEAHEEIGIESEGEPLEIAFNIRYLSDVLKVIEDDTFEMKFISAVNPCVLVPCEGKDYLYMVLPLRLA